MKLKRLVSDGKLAIGPFFSQFDEWLPSAESMVRNCLYATALAFFYERLEEKDRANLLIILAKRIIVNPEGLIVDQELHSPFTYLRNLADSSGGFHRDSEQVRLGEQKLSISNNFLKLSSF